jgi:hypothetical protein
MNWKAYGSLIGYLRKRAKANLPSPSTHTPFSLTMMSQWQRAIVVLTLDVGKKDP